MSDPGGQRLLQPLDVWNADERGGIGWPTLLVYDPDGHEVLRVRSRDFADRPTDDDVFDAVRRLQLPAIEVAPAPAEAEPEEDPGALRAEAFGPYFRGIRFGTAALARRMSTEEDRQEAMAMSAMAASFLDAWKQRREAAGPPPG